MISKKTHRQWSKSWMGWTRLSRFLIMLFCRMQNLIRKWPKYSSSPKTQTKLIDSQSNWGRALCARSIKHSTVRTVMSVGQWEWWKSLNKIFCTKSKSKPQSCRCAPIRILSTTTLRIITWTASSCSSSLWTAGAWLRSSINTWKLYPRMFLLLSWGKFCLVSMFYTSISRSTEI